MKTVQLNDDEIYRHLNQPFNPPTLGDEGYDEKDFSSEWHQVNGQLRKLLDRHGEFDDYGEKDFLLGETLTLSRGIGVEVTSERLLSKSLLPDVQELLCSLEEQYEIDFAISTTEGFFHLFVSKDRVRTNCPTSIMERLL